MKVRNKLYSTVVISILLVALLAISIIVTSSLIAEKNQKRELATDLQLAVAELDILAHEYFLYHKETTQKHWNTRYSDVAKVLREEGEEGEEKDKRVVETLRSNYIDLGRLFLQITRNYNKRQSLIKSNVSQEKIANINELEDELISEFLTISREIVSDSASLGAISDKRADDFQRFSNMFVLVSMIILTVIITATLLLVTKSITSPINKLIVADKKFSKGEYSTRVNIASKDEFEKLGKAVNEKFRTVESRDKELKKAYNELRKLDQLKSVFLSMTSHELKTPITPMRLQAQNLLSEIQGKLNPKQKKSVEAILRNSNHLNDLITDVLDSAKLEANQLKMFPEKTYLKPLIQNIIKDVEQTAHQKNVTITSTIQKLPLLMIDSKRFKQVLLNLLANSVKFTPKNGKIIVSAKQKNKQIIVTVTDTGIGIAPNMITKIFDKFVQSSPSYKLKQKGTGLGLTICKGIVSKFGGKIWAESKGTNKGASFHFTIPLKNRRLL
jgi:signal transduction histidine kinase